VAVSNSIKVNVQKSPDRYRQNSHRKIHESRLVNKQLLRIRQTTAMQLIPSSEAKTPWARQQIYPFMEFKLQVPCLRACQQPIP
jgi:hypothetical protein